MTDLDYFAATREQKRLREKGINKYCDEIILDQYRKTLKDLHHTSLSFLGEADTEYINVLTDQVENIIIKPLDICYLTRNGMFTDKPINEENQGLNTMIGRFISNKDNNGFYKISISRTI